MRRLRHILPAVDLGVGSLVQVIIGIVIARSADLSTFGQYGVLVLVVSIAQGVMQSGVSDIILRGGGDTRVALSFDRRYSVAQVVTVATGVIALLSHEARVGAMLLGASYLVSVLRADLLRAVFLRAGCFEHGLALALANGAGRLGVIVLLVREPTNIETVALSLALGSLPGVLIAEFARHHTLGRGSYGSGVSTIWRKYVWEGLLLTSAHQVATLAFVAGLGLSAAAGVRSGQILLGPLTLLASAERLLLFSWLASRPRSAKRVFSAAGSLALMNGAWTLAMLALLPSFGTRLLGASASVADDYLPVMGFAAAAYAAYLVPFVSARLVHCDAVIKRTRIMLSLVVTLGLIVGLCLKSPDAFFGLQLVGFLIAALWTWRSVTNAPVRP